VFMDPDMDMERSLNVKNWTFLKIFWKPYADYFPHRRQVIRFNLFPKNQVDVSHHWWFGTVSRVVYLAPLIGLVLFCRYKFLGNGYRQFEIDFLESYKYASFCIVGVWIADVLHILQDMFYNKRGF